MVEVRPNRLSRADGITLARISGVATRYGHGSMRDAARDVALAEVQAVSTDPVLLGIAAGHAMVDPYDYQSGTVELLRAAGADMAVAELARAELQGRIDRRGGSGGHRY